MAEKLEFSDLLIITLQEHEKKLDELIHRLEEAITSIEKAAQIYARAKLKEDANRE